jgi:hypothetical protein
MAKKSTSANQKLEVFFERKKGAKTATVRVAPASDSKAVDALTKKMGKPIAVATVGSRGVIKLGGLRPFRCLG